MERGRSPAGRATAIAAGAGGVLAGLRPDGRSLPTWLMELGASFGAALRRLFRREIEERRLFLWLPVAVGVGVLAYFAAEQEPSWWAPALGLVVASSGALAARARSRPAFIACVAAAAIFAGFLAATLRTLAMAAPVLDRVRVAKLTGTVEAVENRISGGRLMIRPSGIEGMDASAIPYRVRLTTPNRPTARAGDVITATARLLPPPEPSRPGGYNFARDAYFGAIGAVGSLSGAIAIVPAPPDLPWDLRLLAAVDRARNAMTERIATAIGGAAGGVAAALVTGKRGLIPEEVNDHLRAAGIYHVVSISGLHLVLAAGMVFWLVRAGLALWPAVALRRPIKKWAAGCAMVAGAGYTVFAGGDVATVRSLVMTLVLLGAMLVDRPALSMRNLALAALLILAIEPESVLAPGFQMSFAAVAALIAVFERPGHGGVDPEAGSFTSLGLPQASPKAPPSGWIGRAVAGAKHHLVGTVLSTLVAEAATGAYGLFHFQRFTPFGLFGNAMTLPLVSLIVMPAALLGAIAYPFGLDGPIWQIMGLGVEGMLRISARIHAWSGSTQAVKAFGAGAVLLLTASLLWLTLWRTALRWLGVPLGLAGVLLAAQSRAPDVVMARDGRALAVRGPEGRMVIVGRQAGSFVTEQWLRADGDARNTGDLSLGAGASCDPLGCVVRMADGKALSQVLSAAAFAEDCDRAAIIVTPLAAPAWCDRPLVLDRTRLAALGAVALVREGEGLRIESERSPQRDRPWIPRPAAPREPSAKALEAAAARARAAQGGTPSLGEEDDEAAASAAPMAPVPATPAPRAPASAPGQTVRTPPAAAAPAAEDGAAPTQEARPVESPPPRKKKKKSKASTPPSAPAPEEPRSASGSAEPADAAQADVAPVEAKPSQGPQSPSPEAGKARASRTPAPDPLTKPPAAIRPALSPEDDVDPDPDPLDGRK
ncbi:ComEC/Rec2 family competence protein [Alsobacter sp. KACC 23698]|uniref:ComEC/Rec2 family competence protein n=1 Tax=Alsobacter sp. KACC 23698 TaxID=3149229 RepID=A0AAU7JMV5_9HYPH